jgi:hypothetical protein
MTPTAQRPSDGGIPGTLPDTWVDRAHEAVTTVITSDWLMYGIAALLAVLLALSIRSRNKRAKIEEAGGKADLTRTDRAITRITGILATAMVATGAWKVFGDVLQLHPAVRLVLFFFAEAQIITAWRRVRRHIRRHAALGTGTRTIYAIAFGSATIAALDANNMVEVAIRFFAAGVAAYMIAEELAEELDIYLTANPDLQPTAQPRGRIKWAVTPERILVWLHLASPTERTVEEVDRRRRIARFARTAYRLHMLTEDSAPKWRITLARRSLRRQAEAANEHLNLAGDPRALDDIQTQIALLFGVEDGTTKTAVSGHNPLRVSVIVGQSTGQPDGHGEVIESGHGPAIEADTRPDTAADIRPDMVADTHRTAAADTLTAALTDTVTDVPADTGTDTLTGVRSDTTAGVRRTVQRPRRRTPDRTPKWSKEQLKAFKLRDTRPDMTYPQIAREVGVSEKTVSRWVKAREAADTETDTAPDTNPVERTSIPLSALPFPEPTPVTVSGTNGNHYPTTEEN